MKTIDYIALGIGSFMTLAHISFGNYGVASFYALATVFIFIPNYLNRKK